MTQLNIQTIDISGQVIGQPMQPTKPFELKTWEAVAEHFGVDPKTIERDREALGRFADPISNNLLQWIRLMRGWCALGNGGRSQFNRRNFTKYRLDGSLEGRLKRHGILTLDEVLPDLPLEF